MSNKFKYTITAMSVVAALAGCSSGSSPNPDVESGGSSANTSTITGDGTSNSSNNQPAQNLVGEIPEGDIRRYGAITVGDDAGMASDLVAAFFNVESGVSLAFLNDVFNGSKTLCTVDDDDLVDFEEISVGFIPSFNGVNKQAIDAGDSIVISSDAGTFATIQSQSAGSFLFYTLPDMQVLPTGALPESLRVDIAGGQFPAYSNVKVPSVSSLNNVSYGDGANVLPSSVFSWTPSDVSGSLVRIFASTAGGFFDDNGVTVTCLAPDTGTFQFPESIQAKLGPDFMGGAPIISRIAVRTESTADSVLFVIRESFAN